VNDPENRVDPALKVSPKLAKRVLFWIDVYSRYDSRMKIVHDRYQPGIVYGHMDFRSIYKKEKNTIKADIKSRKLEKKILKELRSRISEAYGLKKTSQLDPYAKAEIQKFLSSIGAHSPKRVKELLETVRTQTGQRDHFLKALHRSRNFLPHIEAVFKEKKVPLVLARIPFVESSFVNHAQSKVGAIGIWQFTRPTARQMISRDSSKWADPVLQTIAAARLLKMYRRMLPDWTTTVTSYNSGVGNVRRLVKKYRAKNMDKLLADPKNNGLGFAGENFYASVMAASLVELYKEKIFSGWLPSQALASVFDGTSPFANETCRTGF